MNDLQTKYENLKEEYFNELAKDYKEFNENEFNRLGKLLDNLERQINISNQFVDKLKTMEKIIINYIP